jgi:hypothetical protein
MCAQSLDASKALVIPDTPSLKHVARQHTFCVSKVSVIFDYALLAPMKMHSTNSSHL